MTQYIDKSEVLAEINLLQDSTMDENSNFCTSEAQAEYDVLCVLEEYLDTLEVKEIGVDLGDPKGDKSAKYIIDTKTLEVKEEPVSKDLEEAARKVGQKYFPDEENIWARPNYEAKKAEYAFMEGANWQKEQMIDKACEWLKSYRQDTPDGTGYIPGIINDKTIEDFKQSMED